MKSACFKNKISPLYKELKRDRPFRAYCAETLETAEARDDWHAFWAHEDPQDYGDNDNTGAVGDESRH